MNVDPADAFESFRQALREALKDNPHGDFGAEAAIEAFNECLDLARQGSPSGLAERVAVLEAAIAQRIKCPRCGGQGVETGVDPIGTLRCHTCMHRWWKGGGPA